MAYSPENNPYIPGDPYSYDLKWIVAEVKKAVEMYEPLDQEFEDLYTYVHDYFENADFENLVDAALQQMINDGTISEVLAPEVQEQVAILQQHLDYQIAVLDGRMDAFTQLAEGSTTGDAELQDIRVAADGVVYPTAGDAVREQIIDTQNYLLERTANLYNSNTVVTGILASSGGINSSETYQGYRTSQFISISGLSYISCLHVKPWGIAFYDASQTFIERLTSSSAPIGAYNTLRGEIQAAYIRVTYAVASYESAMIAAGNDTTLPYVPYMQFKAPDYVFTTEKYDPVFFPAKVRQAAWRGNTRNSSGTEIAPENSWSAYKNAIDNGFDMLWVAVIQYSSSGKFYCSHDNQLTIGGVTDEFYNFTDAQIQSVTLSDGSKIPELEDVIKYCALNGIPVGFRLGRLANNYTHTLIGNTNLYRDDVWDNFIDLIKRYDLTLTIFSGSDAQCTILHSLEPLAHIQNTSLRSNTTADLLQQIDTIKAIGADRCSVNIYISDENASVIFTEAVMEKARANNIRVFAVTSEPIATAAEIEVIKDLCPDFVITHSKLDFSEIPS